MMNSTTNNLLTSAPSLEVWKRLLIRQSHDDMLISVCLLELLGMLGIPFLDVVRVLAAVILIGNVQFKETSCMEMDVEVSSMSCYLGASFCHAFTNEIEVTSGEAQYLDIL
jgi:hypothetical protein